MTQKLKFTVFGGITIIVVFIFMILQRLYPYLEKERKAGNLLQLCETLKLGMTKEKVIDIMGEPRSKNELIEEGSIQYYFLSPSLASEFTSVEIKNGKVIRTTCGEGYGVYEPTTQTTTSTE